MDRQQWESFSSSSQIIVIKCGHCHRCSVASLRYVFLGIWPFFFCIRLPLSSLPLRHLAIECVRVKIELSGHHTFFYLTSTIAHWMGQFSFFFLLFLLLLIFGGREKGTNGAWWKSTLRLPFYPLPSHSRCHWRMGGMPIIHHACNSNIEHCPHSKYKSHTRNKLNVYHMW